MTKTKEEEKCETCEWTDWTKYKHRSMVGRSVENSGMQKIQIRKCRICTVCGKIQDELVSYDLEVRGKVKEEPVIEEPPVTEE